VKWAITRRNGGDQIALLTETERAYLAGIIDGEGSIMLIHHPPYATSGHRWEYWVLRVSVANCDMRLIDWITDKFGGGFSTGINHRPNQRDAFMWRIDNRRCIPILQAVMPYLLLKRRQAEIALEFAETHRLVGRKGHPAEMIERRRLWAQEMKALNRRGR